MRHVMSFPSCVRRERLGLLLDNRDDMLREAKKMRKELRVHLRMLGLEWLS
jgi:hypothetical protein